MSRFKLTEPVALTGDKVLYRDRDGRAKTGTVMNLETTYGYPRLKGHGTARHSYGILPDGKLRKDWVSDKEIREIIS